jgi:hypothetical protein
MTGYLFSVYLDKPMGETARHEGSIGPPTDEWVAGKMSHMGHFTRNGLQLQICASLTELQCLLHLTEELLPIQANSCHDVPE